MLGALLLAPAGLMRGGLPGSAPCAPAYTTWPRMQATHGGDLEGGQDEARNAEILALKKAFYAEEQDAPSDGWRQQVTQDALCLGLHLDLPLARWNTVLLPHQQTVLNVFQPECAIVQSNHSSQRPASTQSAPCHHSSQRPASAQSAPCQPHLLTESSPPPPPPPPHGPARTQVRAHV